MAADESAPEVPGYRITGLLRETERWRLYHARSERTGEAVLVRVLHEDGSGAESPYALWREEPPDSYAALVEREGPLAPERVAAVGLEIAAELEPLHEAGMVHGDIGLHRLLLRGAGAELASGRAAGQPEGAPFPPLVPDARPAAETAPEAFAGGRQSPRSDVYLLAAALWTLLTGRPPHGSGGDEDGPDSGADASRERLRGAVPPGPAPAGTPPALVDLLETALAEDPAQRPADARAFARALEAAVGRAAPGGSGEPGGDAAADAPAGPAGDAGDADGGGGGAADHERGAREPAHAEPAVAPRTAPEEAAGVAHRDEAGPEPDAASAREPRTRPESSGAPAPDAGAENGAADAAAVAAEPDQAAGSGESGGHVGASDSGAGWAEESDTAAPVPDAHEARPDRGLAGRDLEDGAAEEVGAGDPWPVRAVDGGVGPEAPEGGAAPGSAAGRPEPEAPADTAGEPGAVEPAGGAAPRQDARVLPSDPDVRARDEEAFPAEPAHAPVADAEPQRTGRSAEPTAFADRSAAAADDGNTSADPFADAWWNRPSGASAGDAGAAWTAPGGSGTAGAEEPAVAAGGAPSSEEGVAGPAAAGAEEGPAANAGQAPPQSEVREGAAAEGGVRPGEPPWGGPLGGEAEAAADAVPEPDARGGGAADVSGAADGEGAGESPSGGSGGAGDGFGADSTGSGRVAAGGFGPADATAPVREPGGATADPPGAGANGTAQDPPVAGFGAEGGDRSGGTGPAASGAAGGLPEAPARHHGAETAMPAAPDGGPDHGGDGGGPRHPEAPPNGESSGGDRFAFARVLVTAVLAAGIAVAIVGGTALGVAWWMSSGTPGGQAAPDPTAQPRDRESSPVPPSLPPHASENPALAPTGVRIVADEGDTVSLAWTDNTSGRASYHVVGGPVGTAPSTLAEGERLSTRITITGLNPSFDYCFTVMAVLSVDEVAPSENVCTQRASDV
ncbi:hypothetical protein FZ103_17440 [Streptomonospora sp. PA3]|uniref:hypothetical protein n=1 Tax=Streptomonospora sp. PA3 TaxID=2607326 RepID=UPI0012DE6387|nr:hypothetical protein [Streptomonospora sp. PA3]MUL42929.1 hypothetical protein [Streptomonospora sp. PA3]